MLPDSQAPKPAQAGTSLPPDDQDLVHAYDAVILIGPYLRRDVTADERATITSDIVACVARPLRHALAAAHARIKELEASMDRPVAQAGGE